MSASGQMQRAPIAPTDPINPYEFQIYVTFVGVEPSAHAFKGKIPDPDRMADRGERDSENVLPRSNVIWYKSSAASWSDPIEVHWANLWGRLQDGEAALAELAAASNRVLGTLVAAPEVEFRDMHVPGACLRFLKYLGAEMEIDVLFDGFRKEDFACVSVN